MTKITLTIEADLESSEQRELTGMQLALWSHEFKYHTEKRHPGNKIDVRIEGYVIDLNPGEKAPDPGGAGGTI